MDSLRVAVIIPAYCEEKLIGRTLNRIPESVQLIVVVDDASPDSTASVVSGHPDPRIQLVVHPKNRGVGAAIFTGYDRAVELGADVLVVMAGDDQMDPADLSLLLTPIREGKCDYAKGNRLLHERAKDMPRLRRWGTRFLAHATSLAAGTELGDTQCGYTAITATAYSTISRERLWCSYGYPNDVLIALKNRGARICEVPVRPVYAEEKSGLRPWHLLSVLRVIARRLLLDTRASASLPERTSPSP